MIDPQTWKAFSPADGSCRAALRDGEGELENRVFFKLNTRMGVWGKELVKLGDNKLFNLPWKTSAVSDNGSGELEGKFIAWDIRLAIIGIPKMPLVHNNTLWESINWHYPKKYVYKYYGTYCTQGISHQMDAPFHTWPLIKLDIMNMQFGVLGVSLCTGDG